MNHLQGFTYPRWSGISAINSRRLDENEHRNIPPWGIGQSDPITDSLGVHGVRPTSPVIPRGRGEIDKKMATFKWVIMLMIQKCKLLYL